MTSTELPSTGATTRTAFWSWGMVLRVWRSTDVGYGGTFGAVLTSRIVVPDASPSAVLTSGMEVPDVSVGAALLYC